MARSSYIWIIVCKKYNEVVGVFTVKHEMSFWINKHLDAGEQIGSWEIRKSKDGIYQVPYGKQRITSAEEFLKE